MYDVLYLLYVPTYVYPADRPPRHVTLSPSSLALCSASFSCDIHSSSLPPYLGLSPTATALPPPTPSAAPVSRYCSPPPPPPLVLSSHPLILSSSHSLPLSSPSPPPSSSCYSRPLPPYCQQTNTPPHPPITAMATRAANKRVQLP